MIAGTITITSPRLEQKEARIQRAKRLLRVGVSAAIISAKAIILYFAAIGILQWILN